jgi:hypothetical protein
MSEEDQIRDIVAKLNNNRQNIVQNALLLLRER